MYRINVIILLVAVNHLTTHVISQYVLFPSSGKELAITRPFDLTAAMPIYRPAAPFNLFDEVTGGGVGTPFPQVDITSARTYSNILAIRGELGTPDVITHLHFIVFGFEGVGAGDAEVMVPAIDNEIAAWRPLRLCVLVVVMVLANLVT